MRRTTVSGAAMVAAGWLPVGSAAPVSTTPSIAAAATPPMIVSPAADVHAADRMRMVGEQIAVRGVRGSAVLAAMSRVPRHEFVPARWQGEAYDDHPLPIGEGQTISQPYIVALMTELAAIAPGARVLEVGTGSGYQAAVLAVLGADVSTIEIVESLARSAEATFARLGLGGIHARHGDGYRGWPEAAPFAAIVVTAAPPEIPPDLVAQLAPGGRLVIPVGSIEQELQVHERTPDGIRVRRVTPVRFVPMTRGR